MRLIPAFSEASATADRKDRSVAVARVLLGLLFILGPSMASADLLWSLNGEHNTVYLLGSMHMLPPGAYPMPPGMEAAYRDSETLVFETDIDAVMSPENQIRLMQLGQLPAGQTLAEQLGNEEWVQVNRRAAQMGLPQEAIRRFRPWFLANLMVLLQLQNAGYEREAGLDLHYWKRGKRDGKSLEWLEPIETQLDVFAGIGESESRAFLRLAMQDLDELADDPGLLARTWQSGNLDDIAADMTAMREQTPQLFRRIHTRRNQQWLPIIEEYLKRDGNVLIVVGAMHLLDDDGLIRLLAERGHDAIPRSLKAGWKTDSI